ncbi:MAG: hypothetical protein GX494_06780 [Clostridiaceae bacterium]|nr:hypothetical protein [Clostridiaceae bacterium]
MPYLFRNKGIIIITFIVVLLITGSAPVYAGSLVPAAEKKVINIPGGTAYIDGYSEFSWDLQEPVELVSKRLKASFKTMWNRNTLYLFAHVYDTEKNSNDTVEIFIGAYDTNAVEGNLHYKLNFDGRNVEGADYSVTALDDGYVVEAAVSMHKNAAPGEIISFDIRIVDADSESVISWNDPANMQAHNPNRLGLAILGRRYNVSCAMYGTPVIDGEKDEVWNKSVEFATNTWIKGIKGAAAKVKTLWDENNLYVYAQINGDLSGKSPENPWENDSVEIFIDQNNGKTEKYEPDDAQYRIDFKNVQSFGAGASAEKIKSAVKAVDNGYIVEAAIALDAIEPTHGTLIGFDFLVNDDRNGDGIIDSIVSWNDGTGEAYGNTSKFGILKLVNDDTVVFSDIYDVAWAERQIEFLASKGFLRAVSGKHFKPLDDITRADFLYFLINTLNLKADYYDNFSDVHEEDYYYEAVATAKKLGITSGIGENMFKPEECITRQEMMTFVVRALNAAGIVFEPADISIIEGYIDYRYISDYAAESVAILVREGLVQGSGNRLNPLHNLTRAEAAVLLYRIYTEILFR